MSMMHPKEYLDPMETAQVQYWTKKWHVSNKQLFDAILETGSMRTNDIKQHLESKGLIWSPFKNIMDYVSGRTWAQRRQNATH